MGEGWGRAVVVGRDENHLDSGALTVSMIEGSKVVKRGGGGKKTFTAREWFIANDLGDVPDLTLLPHIHEPALLANLAERIGRDRPYTWLGAVLLAVNPLKAVESPLATDYRGEPWDPNYPHPYAQAELARNQLMVGFGDEGSRGAGVDASEPEGATSGLCFRDQAVVVSGESGAGKSETAKILISFLTNEDGEAEGGGAEGACVDLSKSTRLGLVQISPIIEAVGNAATMRNKNSSRFGKFVQLFYRRRPASASTDSPWKSSSSDSKATTNGEGQANALRSVADEALTIDGSVFVGASVTTYLLEKSRVVHQPPNERNFHIFYQV